MSHLAVDTPTVNSIGYIWEGDHAGSLEITVSQNLLSSQTIIAHPNNTMGIASLGNDDLGHNDLESNILAIQSYIDKATGESHENGTFLLPADSFRDSNALDWILAPKSSEDSTGDLFSDLMQEEFKFRVDMPKPSQVQLVAMNAAYDRSGMNSGLDE